MFYNIRKCGMLTVKNLTYPIFVHSQIKQSNFYPEFSQDKVYV